MSITHNVTEPSRWPVSVWHMRLAAPAPGSRQYHGRKQRKLIFWRNSVQWALEVINGGGIRCQKKFDPLLKTTHYHHVLGENEGKDSTSMIPWCLCFLKVKRQQLSQSSNPSILWLFTSLRKWENEIYFYSYIWRQLSYFGWSVSKLCTTFISQIENEILLDIKLMAQHR